MKHSSSSDISRKRQKVRKCSNECKESIVDDEDEVEDDDDDDDEVEEEVVVGEDDIPRLI